MLLDSVEGVEVLRVQYLFPYASRNTIRTLAKHYFLLPVSFYNNRKKEKIIIYILQPTGKAAGQKAPQHPAAGVCECKVEEEFIDLHLPIRYANKGKTGDWSGLGAATQQNHSFHLTN